MHFQIRWVQRRTHFSHVQSRSELSEASILSVMVSLGWGFNLGLAGLWLTAEAEGHHVSPGTIAVLPCHFHSCFYRPQAASQRGGEMKRTDRKEGQIYYSLKNIIQILP